MSQGDARGRTWPRPHRRDDLATGGARGKVEGNVEFSKGGPAAPAVARGRGGRRDAAARSVMVEEDGDVLYDLGAGAGHSGARFLDKTQICHGDGALRDCRIAALKR